MDNEMDGELPKIPEVGMPEDHWMGNGIRVVVEALGVRYVAVLPVDADPEEVGRLVSETVVKLPLSLSWTFRGAE